MSFALKKMVKNILGANSYSEEAPTEAEYPYSVFSLHRLNVEDDTEVYNLEVNVWDKHPYYSRAEVKMDEIERLLDHNCFFEDKMFFKSYKGDRQNLEDDDKQIKRVREVFTLYFSTEE